MITDKQQEEIALLVIKILVSRFTSFPDNSSQNRNAPFHEAFLAAFKDKLADKVPDIPYFISLSSWLHGLNTTLGMTFFEQTAHVLSSGEKREFTEKRGTRLNWTDLQQTEVTNIIADLRNTVAQSDLTIETERLLSSANKGKQQQANSFTADVFIQDDDRITAIELKAVQPNAGEVRGEKQKILEAKAALMYCFPQYEVAYYWGFPFDPTSDEPCGYDKERFLLSIVDGKKYLATDEILLAGELWDFLSGGKDTMQEILGIINAIATPEFEEKFQFINQGGNRQKEPDKYKQILQSWFLFSELYLALNDEQLCRILQDSDKRSDIRQYNNSPFNGKGHYNYRRYQLLAALLDEKHTDH